MELMLTYQAVAAFLLGLGSTPSPVFRKVSNLKGNVYVPVVYAIWGGGISIRVDPFRHFMA